MEPFLTGILIKVKKTTEEAAALETSATERERLKKQRREEQERNVARKKEAKEGLKADTAESGDGREDHDEAAWEDQDMSEGEESLNEDDTELEEDDSPQRPPQKKVRIKTN